MTEKLRFDAYKLAAHERPTLMYDYWVTGSGVFPFDMMRHDLCWPATGEDACKLEWERIKERGRGLRSLRIRSYRPPTIARWSSFGWSVGTEKLEG
jgi:hypothetical protein